MSTTPTATLNNGVEMPLLGFGVYQIPAEQTEAAVGTALEVGAMDGGSSLFFDHRDPAMVSWLNSRRDQ